MQIYCNTANPPLGGLITAAYLTSHKFEICWGNKSEININNQTITYNTDSELCLSLARLSKDCKLTGSSIAECTEVDHWLTFSLRPITKQNVSEIIVYLDKILEKHSYLVAKCLTVADICVFATLYANVHFQNVLSQTKLPVNILRWYNYFIMQSYVTETLKSLSAEVKNNLVVNSKSYRSKSPNRINEKQRVVSDDKTVRNQEGRFVDLPGAEMGKVIVRFPPEASGYLHIGHAKAALLNQYYQQAFNGKLIMRFDDTNPAKENVHFEEVILEDVAMLQIKPDLFTYTSDYFDVMLEYCEKLMKDGKAYVDDTEPELMKQQREQRVESTNRNNPIERNFQLWEEMKKGTENGQKCCVRAKIDMQSANGCMRDPTIYRCKNESHPRTGTKYKVYPTYDFACPIVDAIENVTHTLRTMEYHDRDDQFYWFIEALGLRRPYIWEYSRLSMTNTVLSKRKLTWFVQEGLVDGWDDPRMPTVRGVLRRGMTVEGLKQFIIAQGSSRSVVFMEWDKIWSINKKVIDPIAPRYTALEHDCLIPVDVNDANEESLLIPKHPKNQEVGNKTVYTGRKVFIESADAELLKENENATFINWGNLKIIKINRTNGKVTSVVAKTNLTDKDYKNTLKLTWLCQTDKAPFTSCYCVYFDHIISKPLLAKDEDFKKYIGHNTRTEIKMIGDPEIKQLSQGDIIQIQRKGFFRVDVPYLAVDPFTSKERPVILFSIPDGHAKGLTANTVKQTVVTGNETKAVSLSETDLNNAIQKQGNVVRELKLAKVTKPEIDAAVKVLLQLKTDYKQLTGVDWKPSDTKTTKSEIKQTTSDSTTLYENVEKQGDKVRSLKTSKAEKSVIDKEVKILLELKSEYKKVMGKDWKPNEKQDSSKQTETNEKQLSQVNENDILKQITAQGEKVRQLKTDKADKSAIDTEVKQLLALKSEYKKVTGKDWKPNEKQDSSKQTETNEKQKPLLSTINENDILKQITAQGEKVRQLKTDKAEKSAIDTEVKQLLALKSEYKKITGKDWKPNEKQDHSKQTVPIEKQQLTSTVNENEVLKQIIAQGDKVRQLKTDKADKSAIDTEVKQLLALKEQFKKLTGKDYKPGIVIPTPQQSSVNKPELAICSFSFSDNKININDLSAKITEQGNLVRNLKSSSASKVDIDNAVKVLLNLKAQYKTETGSDFPAAGKTQTKQEKTKETKEQTKKVKTNVVKEQTPPASDSSGLKKQTRLGLEAKKEENLSDWYSQVITKGEMIEYYDVSGCYIYRPWSFAIWEIIRDWFDAEIKKLGVQNCYFPIFVSKSVLEKEKKHIADFAPEVAWVTRSGDSEMAEPIAVRPTSETVMYPAYAKWIQSYRDLPLRLNQWNNVVRWEFKHPHPFLRTREFLWQEGHTAYATKKEADEEVLVILDLYEKIYTDLLAIPVIKGRKTEKEKFAGGDYTTTVEAYISAGGRAVQGATSHHLGQNFSKMFEIVYEDPETQEKQYVFQNSWGVTTRTIGVMIMVHSDNNGLVLPPRVASIQIIIVPCGITATLNATDKEQLLESCGELEKVLLGAGVRVKGDYRPNYSPGWKFNHWELKGVPIRIELGPKDLKNNQLVAVRRDTSEKIVIKRDGARDELVSLLNDIQNNLYKRALDDLNNHKIIIKDWKQFCVGLDKNNMILSPFCGDINCEDKIKADSARDDGDAAAPSMGAKSLCIPFEQPAQITPKDKCIYPTCALKPLNYTLFGRSY